MSNSQTKGNHNMKLKTKLLSIAAAISMIATPLFAHSQQRAVSGVVIVSIDRGAYSYQQVPVQRCYAVNQSRPSNGGDVLTGMIIGALIGKGATGTDQGAAAGAVIGGVIAGDNNNRHSSHQVCETVWENQRVYRLGRYETTIMLDTGRQITIFLDQQFNYEDRILVPVELVPAEY